MDDDKIEQGSLVSVEEGIQGHSARFEGVKLRLRKALAGRSAIQIEVALAFPEPRSRGQQARLRGGKEAGEPREGVSGQTFAARTARSPRLAEAVPALPTGKAKARPKVKLADVQPGQKNRSVLLIQQALKRAVGLDYSSGPGTFGPRTRKAYTAWQRKCGISVDAANGRPEIASLRKLGETYGFTVLAGGRPAGKGRMPEATWRPIPIHYTPNGQREVRGVVVHIMDGTLAGTDSWFRNKKANASAHFGTSKTGRLYQWVSTRDRAWAQRDGNTSWLSVENEGHGGDTLTPKQLERCAQILAWAHRAYGVPLRVATSPSGRGLGHHSMGGPAWGHLQCPGPRIIAQKKDIVARAKRIVSGPSRVRAEHEQGRSLHVDRAQEHTEGLTM